MIILLHGDDTLRLNRKSREIVVEYQAKHKSGLNLKFFHNDFQIDQIKAFIGSISMFEEKKLVVLNDVLNNAAISDELVKYIKKNKLSDDADIIMLITQTGKVPVALKRLAGMVEDFKALSRSEMMRWVSKKAKFVDVKTAAYLVDGIIGGKGDLWQLENETEKLIAYKNGQPINIGDVDDIVGFSTETSIFSITEAFAGSDVKRSLYLAYKFFNEGGDDFYLFRMFVFQLRVMIKVRSLMEAGMSNPSQIAEASGLHPFVVRKNMGYVRSFSWDRLMEFHKTLLRYENWIKSGYCDAWTAVNLLIVSSIKRD